MAQQSLAGKRREGERVKAEIVHESYRDGASVADIARKHGISGPQLHAWRRAARDGVPPLLGVCKQTPVRHWTPDDDMLGLAPVVVAAADDDGSDSGEPREEGALVPVVDGVRIIVPLNFGADHLRRVIASVRTAA